MTLAIESKVVGNFVFVRLNGELDHHAVERLRDEIEKELEATHHRGLVLSFRGIDFMDSSGLGLILGRYRSVKERGGKMAICEVSPPLKKLFELSGILKIIPLFESEEEAVQSVKEA
jgi:stage II sporulation protein AA (anti-sigma F factor antagonist)